MRSPLAATLLETMAFLAPDAIEVALLAPLAGDELDLHDAVGELLRLSLVDRKAGQLRMHGLLQDVIRDRLPESDTPGPLHRRGRAVRRAGSW